MTQALVPTTVEWAWLAMAMTTSSPPPGSAGGGLVMILEGSTGLAYPRYLSRSTMMMPDEEEDEP